MIIVKLNGGLGNQLFQYAAGRSLSELKKTKLELDIGYLSGLEQKITTRKYELDHFNICSGLANRVEVAEISGTVENRLESLIVKLRKLFGFSKYKPQVFRESSFNVDEEFFMLSDNSYIVGFWQSEMYFKNIEKILRSELMFSEPAKNMNRIIGEQISKENSVFVHVRRGDYVSHPDVAKFNGICGVDYYESAFSLIAERVKAPVLYIFSDEPEWVRENMNFPFQSVIVDNNGTDEAHEDLRLMSLCKHAIIANSSFSWWGAWMITGNDKIVVAPKKWFADSSVNTTDVIPGDWIRI